MISFYNRILLIHLQNRSRKNDDSKQANLLSVYVSKQNVYAFICQFQYSDVML